MRRSCGHLANGIAGAVTSGSPSGRGAVWDAIHAAWAEEDARLRAWLDVAAGAQGCCRHCGAKLRAVTGRAMPMVCAKKKCKRLAKKTRSKKPKHADQPEEEG